jgi:hypothetical protein
LSAPSVDGGSGGPARAYGTRCAEHQTTLAALALRSSRLSSFRIWTFLAAAGAGLAWDVVGGVAGDLALGVAGTLSLTFVWQVAVHRRVRARMRWHEALLGLSREGLLRLDRDWPALAAALPAGEARTEPAEPGHPFARDLDVVGDASLMRLAGPVTSERGRARLRSWLLAPADRAEVASRQEAARALAPRLDLRQTFSAHGRVRAAKDPPGTDRFLAWAEGQPWLSDRRALSAAAWILPPVLVGLLLADLMGGAPPYWLIPAVVHALILRQTWSRLQADFLLAEDGLALLTVYVPQFSLLEEQRESAPLLAGVAARLGTGPSGASARLHRLSRLLNTTESRRNVFYGILAAVLLMDLHLARALDRWRAESGPQVRDWLEALGEWEALSALGSLAHDHPTWAFPEIAGPEVAAPEDPVVRGTALGHPLLAPARCVRNDVEVGPVGTFLLVTGSNMSGKSTLLRALGANVVLAGAGAPVCAEAFRLPRVRVWTSMRIEDSLSEGVSLFMAELLRIRGIVEASDARPGAPPVLYLLDEILHGTNTAERRVAARAVIRHLLSRPALGAVSTHDLTLAQAPDLEAAARPVHFRESVERVDGRTRLDFDYTLRPGLATTRNALKLLDAVGLGALVADGDADADPDPDAYEAEPGFGTEGPS